MDGRFPVKMYATISWDDLSVAMVMRYLPPDHNICLQLVFERTVQRTRRQPNFPQFCNTWI
eukprot:2782065-Rhodomonas_salina.1